MVLEDHYLDKRVVRTKKLLKFSLITLLKKKKFNDITITDIVSQANLNRGSFYNHFENKEDLLNQLFDDNISEMIKAYRKPYIENNPFIVSHLTPKEVHIFKHVEQNSQFYSIILKSDVFYIFQTKLHHAIKEINKKDLFKYTSKINRDFFANYLTFAILGLIFSWVENGFEQDADFMAEQLLKLMNMPPKYFFKNRIRV